MTSTPRLVEAAQAGDAGASEELVRGSQDLAMAVAVGHAPTWEDARDAAQEAFATALVHLGDLRDPAAFPGWLAALVRSACSRRTRRRQHPTGSLDGIDPAASAEGDPASQVAERDERQRVRAPRSRRWPSRYPRSWDSRWEDRGVTDASAVIGGVIEGGARVLEVGCGSSPHARTTVGLDRDRRAASSVEAGPAVVVGDAARLPFAAGCFDVVLAQGAVHHLDDVAGFVREARRVLGPGGSLVILDAEPMPERDYRSMCEQLRSSGAAPEPLNGVDPAWLEALVQVESDGTFTSLGAGTWTHATPPYTKREFSSPALLHVASWAARR